MSKDMYRWATEDEIENHLNCPGCKIPGAVWVRTGDEQTDLAVPEARVETQPDREVPPATPRTDIRASGLPYVIRAKDSDGAEWDQLFTSELPVQEALNILENAMREVQEDVETWNWGVVMDMVEPLGVHAVPVFDTEEEL